MSLEPIRINSSELFHQHHTLPPLPGVVHEIQEMLRDEAVDIKRIANLVSSDAALAAQVLKIVNSAYFGLKREISDLKLAIAFLGLNEIYRIVLAISVIKTIDIENRDELDRFWFHSFYTALTVKYLGKHFAKFLEQEELWSAALLHDIGKLVYLKFFPDHYQAIAIKARKNGRFFSWAEKTLDLPPSAHFGALLCKFWRLPGKVQTACSTHTLEDLNGINPNDSDGEFKMVICLGNLLSQIAVDGLDNTVQAEVGSVTMRMLKLSEEDFLAHMTEVQALRFEVEEFMNSLR